MSSKMERILELTDGLTNISYRLQLNNEDYERALIGNSIIK